MTDKIEKVTLENAADQLKAKIRMAFVELLPDEQWKEMVSAELKRFMQDSTRRDSYNSRDVTEPSAFSKICSEIFTEHIKAEIKKLLQDPEWVGQWGNNGEQISSAINAWLTQNSAALIQSTVQALASQAAQNLVTSMRHL